jgi:uncharacterized protein (TIGR02246 family)
VTTAQRLDTRSAFERYSSTFASCNPDAIVELHTEDSQFWLHLGEEPIRGRQAIRDRFAEYFEQWPSFGFDSYRVRFGDDHWVLDWALTAVLPNGDGTHRPIRFDCIDLVEVDDHGLVVRKDTFVDLVQAQQALTAPTD